MSDRGAVEEALAQRVPRYENRTQREDWEQAIVDAPETYREAVGALMPETSPTDDERRGVVLQTLISAWCASTRSDLELNGVRVTEDVVIDWHQDFQALAANPSRTVGWADASAEYRAFTGEWSNWTMVLRAFVDHGRHIVSLGKASATGAASGVPVKMDFCQIYRLRDGLMDHMWNVSDPAEALRIGGVDPAVLPRIDALSEGEMLRIGPEQLFDPPED